MANRTGLTVIDGSTRYPLPIAKDYNKDGRLFSIEPKPWEVGDPQQYWKTPLHPWDGGLDIDRLTNSHCYAAANADLSNRGLLVPPPLINLPTMPTAAVEALPAVRGTSVGHSTTTTVVVGKPSGTADGDVMIAVINSDVAITTLAGWTLMATGVTPNSKAMYRVVSGDGADYTFAAAGASVMSGAITTFTGIDTAAPFNAGAIGDSDTTPFVCPTVTTTVVDCVIFCAVAIVNNTLFTPPTGFTELSDLNVTYSITTAWKQVTAIGATGTFTFAGTNSDGYTFTIALKPSIAAPNVPAFFTKQTYFNSKNYTFNGGYLYSIDSAYTVLVEKDFGILRRISDICVYKDKLIIAFGYSTVSTDNDYLYSLDKTGVFTRATAFVAADLLCTVGKNLWRSRASISGETFTSTVSSTSGDPLTASDWGAEYSVGGSFSEINCLIDYAGTINVGKPDGLFVPDVNTDFWNQIPQLKQWPHIDNCKGAFVAKGYLWVPSVAGLIRMSNGEAVMRGPEKSNRKNYQWWVRGGFEWSESIYLLCNDRAASSQTVIIKMLLNQNSTAGGQEYIYHEWCRLGSTLAGYMIGIMIAPTNPSIFFAQTLTLKYIKLGRGGSQDIEDSNYGYGLSWELETGSIRPSEDLSVITGLIGLTIVADQDASETIDTIQYKIEEGNYVNMLTTQEGAGTMPLTNTSGYTAATRYAAVDAQGQFFGFKLAGSISDAHLGTDRPEIREVYAFGYTRPRQTDLIHIPIYASQSAVASNGIRQGRTSGQLRTLLNRWKRNATSLVFELPDYEESRVTRGRVVAIKEDEISIISNTGGIDKRETVIITTIQRDDFAGAIYDA